MNKMCWVNSIIPKTINPELRPNQKQNWRIYLATIVEKIQI